MMAVQSWHQQCQAIQKACTNSDWGQVIQECNELIRYAQQQSSVTTTAASQTNAQQSFGSSEQQQLLIQAHAEQD